MLQLSESNRDNTNDWRRFDTLMDEMTMEMKQEERSAPKEADRFAFAYRIQNEKNIVLESSNGRTVVVKRGSGSIPATIEQALLEMNPGERRRITLGPDQAFGSFNPDLIFQVPGAKLKGVHHLGDTIDVVIDEENAVPMRIADYKCDFYVLDGNHRYAGMTLTYEIELTACESSADIESYGTERQSRSNGANEKGDRGTIHCRKVVRKQKQCLI